jgi:hypothetical protein
MHKDHQFRRTQKNDLDTSIRAGFSLAQDAPAVRAAYGRLLRHVQQRTGLLRDRRASWINSALSYLARHHADWVRPVESWQPPATGPNGQFNALARHLFALYPVPGFMTWAWIWCGSDSPEQQWYKHLGRGGSVRTLDLPLPCTRSMAHHFRHAPDHYHIPAALRWAQVRGLGGNERLAEAVASTRLGRTFENKDFWLTALQFFVRHPRMDPDDVGPIVAFVQDQRFGPRQGFVPGHGLVEMPPPQPDYSFEGRTPASVLCQVEQWRRQLGLARRTRPLVWCRSGIGEFEWIDHCDEQEAVRRWTICELLSSHELFEEGRVLQHCVAIYARGCVWGARSLWSLRVDRGDGPKRALTIEVDSPKRRIREVRGLANREPRASERAILEQWADREGLCFADHL